PGLLKQASPASGGHKVVALRGLLPFMLSMSKHPLAFRLYPLALIHDPITSHQSSNIPIF
ncbi:MAG: hypothetical protein WBI25_05795, partial [Smithellaceae bacterium]